MTSITVDLPILEAKALAKRLAGNESLTAAECDAVQRGHQRLVRALGDETGLYASGIETIAASLIGEEVRVERQDGRVYEGELEKITGFRTALIKDEPFAHPVNLSSVRSIEARRAVAA